LQQIGEQFLPGLIVVDVFRKIVVTISVECPDFLFGKEAVEKRRFEIV